MHLDQVVVSLLVWEACGDTVVQKARIGTLSHGLKAAKALLLLCSADTTLESLALNVLGQDQSGEKIFVLHEDWELARGGLELPHRPGYVVPGNGRGLVAGLLLPRRAHCPSKTSPSLTVDGL